MNFAEWGTLLFLPLAVMSDFSQLGLIDDSNTNIVNTKSKCSYCPDTATILSQESLREIELMDCDSPDAITTSHFCFYLATTADGTNMTYQVDSDSYKEQPHCSIKDIKS
jgi:hypothetical protein